MQKHIANVISVSRIALLGTLFFALRNPLVFSVIYITCGLSDVLDGYIARKTKTESELGARLDSIADLIFFAVVIAVVIVWMGSEILIFLPLIAAVVFVRLANIGIAAIKFHSFAILHTWGNKLTGMFVFALPLLVLCRQPALLWAVCIVAFLSAVEEAVIHITAKNLNVNRRSLFIN